MAQLSHRAIATAISADRWFSHIFRSRGPSGAAALQQIRSCQSSRNSAGFTHSTGGCYRPPSASAGPRAAANAADALMANSSPISAMDGGGTMPPKSGAMVAGAVSKTALPAGRSGAPATHARHPCLRSYRSRSDQQSRQKPPRPLSALSPQSRPAGQLVAALAHASHRAGPSPISSSARTQRVRQ